MSGGGGNESGGGQIDRSGLPKYQNRQVRGAIGQTGNVYRQGLPQVEQLSSPYGPVATTGAMGNQLAQNTLQGDYLNPQTNQYLNAYANAADQNLVQNYMNAIAPSTNAEFAMAGNFGGSAMMDAQKNNELALANAIGNTNANIYEPAYQQERQLQAGTINQEPIAQQGLYTAPNAPLNYQNEYNRGLMGLVQPYGYNTQNQYYPGQGGPTVGQGLGAGLGLAGLALI